MNALFHFQYKYGDILPATILKFLAINQRKRSIARFASLEYCGFAAGVSGGLPPGSEELKKEKFLSREAILLFPATEYCLPTSGPQSFHP